MKELVKPETGHSLEAGKEPLCEEVGDESESPPFRAAAKGMKGVGGRRKM